MTEHPDPASSPDDAAPAAKNPPPLDPESDTVAYSPPPEPHPDWMR
jgi:hypothetical protein